LKEQVIGTTEELAENAFSGCGIEQGLKPDPLIAGVAARLNSLLKNVGSGVL